MLTIENKHSINDPVKYTLRSAALAAACLLAAAPGARAQVNYTANDVVPPYEDRFRPGINIDYAPPYTTTELGALAAGDPERGIPGVGAEAVRLGLFDVVAHQYGVDILEGAFDEYASLGLDEATMMVGFPNPENRDWENKYCNTLGQDGEVKWNAHFRGIYEPIWDDGTDGTPYNDDNLYASYVYRVVSNYTDEVRFWEIWNEPGLYKGDWAESEKFWGGPDYPGSWWVNDPDPCDYYLHAPIEHFVRVLRISYEVIKTISPDDYVTLSGLGAPSFLDAIMRNTDNPVDGSVTAEFPLLGGAYFDVLGFHTYPHFDGSTKFGDYEARHSDGAADGIIDRALAGYQDVAYKYGYDGSVYPAKHHICTEVNIPRVDYSGGNYVAGNEAQLNFLQKCLASFKINDVYQMHVWSIGDQRTDANANYEFHQMGLYDKLDDNSVGRETRNDGGVAYKTASDLLYNSTYDPARTADLAAPDGVRAYAFARDGGGYVYMLWAETRTDLSEAASATYSFPAGITEPELTRIDWDYGRTGTTSRSGTSGIALDATPIYLIDANVVLPVDLLSFDATREAGANVLRWATASETNNRGFEVEHAAGSATGFEVVGSVAAAGERGAGADYDFTHATTALGTHYYRLRQVDNDGTSSLSAVVSVSVAPDAALVRISPNPATDHLTFGGLAAGTDVVVRDVSGRAVLTTTYAGTPLDVSGLASGLYVVSFEGAGAGTPLRFVKR